MKILQRHILALIFVAGLLFLSCQKELHCPDCVDAPIANAGHDIQLFLPLDSTILDGSGSSDPGGSPLQFQWTKIEGPGATTLHQPSIARSSLKNLTAGIHRFELKVTNNSALSDADTVQVTVLDTSSNRPPIANAGRDTSLILPDNSVTLNGTASYDPDNNIVAYHWAKLSGPGGANILTPGAARTSVFNLSEGNYEFELRVTDAGGLYSTAVIGITVNGTPLACDNPNRPTIDVRLEPLGTISEARSGMAVASAGNKILFAGASLSHAGVNGYGSSRVDIYNTSTNSWSTAQLSERRSHIAAVSSGNKIFFAGGNLSDGVVNRYFTTVDIYDVITNTWSVINLSEPRAYIAAAAVGNKVIFAGGEKNMNYDCSDVIDIYDVSTNSWTSRRLGTPRSGISAVTVGNKVYFAAGTSENRRYTPSEQVDIFDNNTGNWSTASLSLPIGFQAGIAAANRLYFAANCSVEIINVDTWTSTMNFLFRTASLPGSDWYGGWTITEGQNAVIKDNKILFYRPLATGIHKFDIYDLGTETWHIGLLPFIIPEASIISVNNTIYLAGGKLNGNLTDKVWKLEF